MAAARAAGLIVIADAKRGDIGIDDGCLRRRVADARIAARGRRDDGEPVPRHRDARATRSTSPRRSGKGVFVLAATSNPDAFTGAARRASTAGRRSRRSIVARGLGAQRGDTTRRRRVGEHRLRDRRDRRLARMPASRPFAPPAPILGPGLRASGRRTRRSRPPLRRAGPLRHREREPQHPRSGPGRTRRGDRGPRERIP